MTDKAYLHYQKKFLNGLLSGNHADCHKTASDFLLHETDKLPVLYEHVIKEALYEVGDLWENNQISIATEHLASAISEAVLNDLYLKISADQDRDFSVVITSVENEFHRMGQKMVSDVFEMHGWHVNALGSNTGIEDIIFFIETASPDIVALSVTLYFNMENLYDMLHQLYRRFPQQNILVGGQAFTQGEFDQLKKYPNVTYVKDLDALEKIIQNYKHE